MSDYKPTALSEHDFETEVIQSDKPVLVDFWAEWCGPCRTIAPALDQLAEGYGEALTVKKLNVDENASVAATYGIRSIPTLLLFKQGEVVETLVGAQSKPQLASAIDQHLQ